MRRSGHIAGWMLAAAIAVGVTAPRRGGAVEPSAGAPPASARAVERVVAGIGVDERLGARVPAGAAFDDEEGRPVVLARAGARPTLLSFNYSRCPTLCSLQLAGLARALRELPPAGLPPFDVLTVGLDPSEPPAERARAKQTYVRQAGGSARIGEAWRFAGGSRQSVDALADAVGFHYRYDAASREYFHPATLVVLTPDGRVSRYLHGISYPPDELRDAIAQAARGEVLTQAAQSGLGGFLLQCIGYDRTGHAPLAVWVMRVAGLVVLAGLASLLVVLVTRDLRRRRSHAPQET